MLLKIKIRNYLTYIIYNIIMLGVAFFFNRFSQMLMFICLYGMITDSFYYRFHADTITSNSLKAIRLCKLITFGIEVIYLIFSIKLNITLYANLLLIVLIAFISCMVEFILEKNFAKKDIFNNKNHLLEACKNANLTSQATNRMVLKYIEHKTYKEIADLECVDETTIKKSINRSRKKILKD